MTDQDGHHTAGGLHGHAHRHDDELEHAHPHHHTFAPGPRPARHEHAHPLSIERHTYLLSPIHSLDPRAKVLSAFLLICCISLSAPMRAEEFALVSALLLSAIVISTVPVRAILLRSLLVVPVAGAIALLAPLSAGSSASGAGGWMLAWGIVSKAWLSVLVVLIVAATTPAQRLFRGLEALGMPRIFLTMLTFLYRYSDTLIDQVVRMRRAIASRGPDLTGRRLVSLYGNLAGSMFIRAYERGERVHAAMLSRGFDGTLPSTEVLRATPRDLLLVVTVLLASLAVVLYS